VIGVREQGFENKNLCQSILPGIQVNPYFASLKMLFYEGRQFLSEFRGEGIAAEHGSLFVSGYGSRSI
jgi:glucose/arabinose dehydrogenase